MIETIILLSTGICCYTSLFGYYVYIINNESRELEVKEEQIKCFKKKTENEYFNFKDEKYISEGGLTFGDRDYEFI